MELFGGVAGAAGAGALAVATRSILSFPIYIGEGFVWLVASYFLAMISSCMLTFFSATRMKSKKNPQRI